MAVFLVNQCKFAKLQNASDPQASPAPTIVGNGQNICGLKFDSLLELIHHIEDNHITDVEFQGISSIHPAYYNVYPSTTGAGHLVHQVVQHPHTPLTPHTPQTPHTPHTPQPSHTPHPPQTPHPAHHPHHHLPHHQQQVYSDNLRMQNIINGHWLPTSCILRIFSSTHKPASTMQTLPNTPLNTYTSIPGAQYYQASPTVYAPVFNSGIQMPVQQIPSQNQTYLQAPQTMQQQQSTQAQMQLSPQQPLQQQPQQALQPQTQQITQQITQNQNQQALQAAIQLAPQPALQASLQAPLQPQLQASLQLSQQAPIHLPPQSPIPTQLQAQIQTPLQTSLQTPIQAAIQAPIQTSLQPTMQTSIQLPQQQQQQSQATSQPTSQPTAQTQVVVKTERIRCPECGRLYKTQKNFNIHMQNNHNKNSNGEKTTPTNARENND